MLSNPGSDTGQRSRLLLAIGAVAGIALAAWGALGGGGELRPAEPGRVVATVNGVAIPRESFERALALLARDRRQPLRPEDRRHVLERLIDEELLVQRGLELGLASSDRGVRKSVVTAMIDAAVLESGTREPGPEDLLRFFEQNRAYFAPTPRLHVRRLFVRAEGDLASARVQAARAREELLDGTPFDTLRERYSGGAAPLLPDGSLPMKTLRDYLGPELAEIAAALEPGALSEPVEGQGGFHVLQLVSREQGAVAYRDVAPQVEAEYRRRADDAALRAYLARLRAEGSVRIAEQAVTAPRTDGPADSTP